MLKNHPRGLFILALANMGERFGFYTMMAIFMLFIQAKYGFGGTEAGQIYGIFLAAVYFMPLFGGIIADRWLGYGKTISIGLIVMLSGYFLLAIPSTHDTMLWLVFISLAVVATGTGLFKGNLQALVGNLYDQKKYSQYRDIAFSIFYMAINIGAMFAPTAARAVYQYFLKQDGLTYNNSLPGFANQFMDGKLPTEKTTEFLELAQKQDPSVTMSSLGEFSEKYIDSLSQAYHYGFGVACISLIISMLIYWGFRKHYKAVDVTEKQRKKKLKAEGVQEDSPSLSPEQTRKRLIALGLVFSVVIFFWMAFHQNGNLLNMFARDYTVNEVGKTTYLWFDLFGLLPVFLTALGLYFAVAKGIKSNYRILGLLSAIGFALVVYFRYQGYAQSNEFTPEMFQHMNPFFIVALTPLVVGLFSWLNTRKVEPSAPKKIGIGMLIAGAAYVVMIIGSLGLYGYSPSDLGVGGVRAPESVVVSVYWLIGTYFTLTMAELFLSPIGISFVSKVSPPQYKGSMQGGWFAATAIGNYLAGAMGFLYDRLPLVGTWAVLMILCLVSAVAIFALLKRLENATR